MSHTPAIPKCDAFPSFFLKAIALFFLAFVGFSAMTHAAPGRPVARAELAKALAFYRTITRIRVRFQETKILKEMNLKLPSEGNLVVTRPNSVRWEVVKPSPLVVFLDDKHVEIISGSGPGEKKESYSF